MDDVDYRSTTKLSPSLSPMKSMAETSEIPKKGNFETFRIWNGKPSFVLTKMMVMMRSTIGNH